jgi:hypothetical protein
MSAPKWAPLSDVHTFVPTQMYNCLLVQPPPLFHLNSCVPSRSKLHFAISPATVFNKPDLQRSHSVTTKAIVSWSQLQSLRFIIARRVSGATLQ